MADGIIGRDPELASIRSLLDGLTSGAAALLIEGEAGIGKSTLWTAGIALALERDCRVLRCRPAESEAQLSYAALGDLLEDVLDDVLGLLPDPQRHALEVAMLRAGGAASPADPRAVSVAALGVVRALAGSGPLLLAVDDVQWLDPSSARVLEFVVRRLTIEPVGILAAVRTSGPGRVPLGLDRALPPQRLLRLLMAPLSVGALSALLRVQLDATLPRPTLLRVREATGGNPLFALELTRALLDRDAELEPGGGLPVPSTLRELLLLRLARLPARGRRLLLAVAALSRPTVGLVERLGDLPDLATRDLERAAQAGIVELDDDRIRFTHPLLGSALYSEASDRQRRRLHQQLAQVVADPEERARHRALGADGPDAQAAGMLDQAAELAHTRGAPDAAAELLVLAGQLTPPTRAADRWRRTTDAARYYYEAGDPARARKLLDQVLASSPSGQRRARALLRQATVLHDSDGPVASVPLLQQALGRAGDDLVLTMEVERELAHDLWLAGDARAARLHARAAVALAERLGDRPATVTARAEELLVISALEGVTPERLEQAASLAASPSGASAGAGLTNLESARQTLALLLMVVGDFDRSRGIYLEEARRVVEQGRDWEREYLEWCLARLEYRAGNFDRAAQHAEASYTESLGREGLQCEALYIRAEVAAVLGQTEVARQAAEEGLATAERLGLRLSALRNRSVLGFLELSLGNLAAAHRQLGPAAAAVWAIGLGEPGYLPFLPDEIEALIGLGELDQAESLLAPFEQQARALDRAWALAAGARCRAMLHAAHNDLPQALEGLDRALAAHRRTAQPFEVGRTLLVAGTVRRRARKWGAARTLLERALASFEELGAPLWAAKTRAELRRIGGRPTASGRLTPTEEQVAELVAAGRSNREVADALFMSVNTVEANLSRIYHKLGVRSRTELGAKLAAQAPPPPPASERARH
jgi:DNA-binding CsgD family transcriptional regulator